MGDTEELELGQTRKRLSIALVNTGIRVRTESLTDMRIDPLQNQCRTIEPCMNHIGTSIGTVSGGFSMQSHWWKASRFRHVHSGYFVSIKYSLLVRSFFRCIWHVNPTNQTYPDPADLFLATDLRLRAARKSFVYIDDLKLNSEAEGGLQVPRVRTFEYLVGFGIASIFKIHATHPHIPVLLGYSINDDRGFRTGGTTNSFRSRIRSSETRICAQRQ
ncbi:uncharacterized protein BP01DRAFT_163604 [Aspergillus saccharolyticus JOP 1030-1]|uniref:Uncharacterized protein n=1 Tax=Aspergillus saccharolyticus JOP 1030-1 TaxID=1450539 RepID=A0A318Z3X2_9EURO|nr:hypothetical protein BP01DRAFT_163604 [Aspergillus saccharolyticus JOP 1030-1]PYH41699.1 hypothetical protein BP01DRAFT_163604 [Aspergillus saccharolyticus JOP 1030-1]